MHWIYLSPHYDDAVLSCGGMIWEQSQAGDTVEIWTICAVSPSRGRALPAFAATLETQWNAGRRAVSRRRAEDRLACAQVGAVPFYGRLTDCIYRRLPDGEALINAGEDLWLPVHPAEMELVQSLRTWLRRKLPHEARVVCPLSLGNHVDHRLVRSAAEGLRRMLWYYADFPYVTQRGIRLPQGWPEGDLYHRPVSEAGFEAWCAGVAAYKTQIGSLFGSQEGMRAQLEAYWRSGGGSWLWPGG